jgi:ADP-ribose pyrophosphatase YjhB (NUDIX family)
VEYIRKTILNGKEVTFAWVGKIHETPARVYALAFASKVEMLLVSGGPDDPYRWLPGGGIEQGETPEKALSRELMEEADAIIESLEYIGSQRLDDSEGFMEFQHYYWCHITLCPPATARVETTLRHLVPPDNFLDTLEWGRTDPKAAMLLEKVIALEQDYQNRS